MLKYRLDLHVPTLQSIHTALEKMEDALAEEGNDKEAFEFYQARKDVEAQLERQGISFISE